MKSSVKVKEDSKMDDDNHPNVETESESDDTDSSDEEDYQPEIERLKNLLCDNPYDYEAYKKLIDVYRMTGDLIRLRETRENMSQKFPLVPTIWMRWIEDECKLVSDDDKTYIIELFERATDDYSSVDIWLEYVQFAIGLAAEGKTREIFEKGIASVGLHVSKGSLIWEAFREFEIAYCDIVPQSEVLDQYKKVYDIFKRQLSIPLSDMEKTFEEFNVWYESKILKTYPDVEWKISSVQYTYEKALSELKKIKKFEKLVQCNEPSLQDYEKYILFEEQNGTPPRVQNLYERAILDHCLIPRLWLSYEKYLNKRVKIEPIILSVHERSLRNCPWSVDLWISYLRTLERLNKSSDEFTKVFEKSLLSGFYEYDSYRQIWVTYLDYIRRKTYWSNDKDLAKLRKCFEAGISDLSNRNEGDVNCTLSFYYAKIEAKYCKNLENAHNILDELFKQKEISSRADMWLEYASIERICGSDENYRKVLLRALKYTKDWPETIGDLLLRYEREENNSFEDFEDSLELYQSIMKKVNEKRLTAAEKEEHQVENKKQTKFEKPERKRKASEFENDFKKPNHPVATPAKLPKTEPKNERVHVNPPVDNDLKNLQTVFLSNLNFAVNENKIHEVFSEFGDILEVRLVKNYKGLSKGYCYVEYKSIESVREALKHDRILIEGRPVFISEKDKRKTFDFKTGIEERQKLFVSNLSFEITKEDLSSIFEKYGTLKDVRVATYRNGHSKGHAYVEFRSASDASKALKADGLLVGDKRIKVQISNPPQKGSLHSNTGAESSLTQPPSHARPKINVPFVPTSVRRNMGTGSIEAKSNSDTPKKLTNDYFKKLFQK